MKYSIVIPCYNEEDNLPQLVATIEEMAKGRDIEFVLVENGSKDGSYELMKTFVKDKHFIKIVKVDVNQGLGYGICQGIKESEGDFVGWIHADMQTPKEDIENFLNYLDKTDRTQLLMVKATRHNRTLMDYFFTNGMAIFCSLLFRRFLYDVQAVPVIASKDLFKSMKVMPHGFAFDMFMYWQAKEKGFEVKRLPVRIFKREKGNSSWNTGLQARIRLSRYMVHSAFEMVKGNYDV
jgi:glycosyltransferase involved in cell wall biosynthesis